MSQWVHAPYHKFHARETYMVTGATLNKQLLFKSNDELDLLQNTFFTLALHYNWRLEAWALFSNHYHFIAQSPENSSTLKKIITHFHASTARLLNELQGTPGRKVWYQYWDTHLSFQNYYLARLNYVMQNPVKHGMVNCAKAYKWCSASWFEQNASQVYYLNVTNFKIDKTSILDDF